MTSAPSKDSKISIASEALTWALEHFAHLDQANAKIHCAPVKYSPLTFRLARTLMVLGVDPKEHSALGDVYVHDGAYEEDPGR